MSTSAKRRRLEPAMARFSETATWTMQKILEGQWNPEHGMSGASKRKFAATLAPARMCYKLLEAPGIDADDPVRFTVADIKLLLRHVAEASDDFAAFVRSQGEVLEVVLSHDETTAGNVLNADARQKVVLFYATFKGLQMRHESPEAWIPVGGVTHAQVERARGGLGKVHAMFVEDWSAQALDAGFQMLPSLRVKVTLALFVADMDAQRAALCAKGSAGLKPCAFCSNCLAKGAAGASNDAHFRTIAEADMNQFQQHDQSSLQSYMSQVLPKLDGMTKGERELRERCLGYRVTPDGMWASPTCCKTLPLGCFVNDSMHCYFANGICSVEIVLLFNEVTKHTGKGPEDVRDAVVAAAWTRPSQCVRHGENPFWRKRLFNPAFFGACMYKGSAKQTRAVCYLLRWVAMRVWQHVAPLQPAVESFLKLCRCLDALNNIRFSKDYQSLAQAQKDHQEIFCRVYTDAVRPKHHHRMHLPQQYASVDFVPTCCGTESKHRDYKSIFASNLQHLIREKDGGATLSQHLLPRLLLRHVEMICEKPCSTNSAILINAFAAEEVLKLTGISDCRIASRCQVGMLVLCEGDLLVWGEGHHEAGKCLFFWSRRRRFLHM